MWLWILCSEFTGPQSAVHDSFDLLKWTEVSDALLTVIRVLNSGLLYYAGHGYENYGNSFMVPIDAPNPYRSANCLCVQNILRLMQEKQTGLNVFLLDMCRKRYPLHSWVVRADLSSLGS